MAKNMVPMAVEKAATCNGMLLSLSFSFTIVCPHVCIILYVCTCLPKYLSKNFSLQNNMSNEFSKDFCVQK